MTAPRPLKVIFMGTPVFAVAALDALYEAGHDIVCVYSQPPRPAGRGHKVQLSPVHKRAEELGIPVRTPVSLKKDADARADFAALGADVAVVAAYGLILPQAVLDAPKFGCLNIHASLLPRWRGAAPIQRAILAGDTMSGICIMQMDAGLDTGDVILRDTVPIKDITTASTLHDALAAQGAGLVVKVLDGIDTLPRTPQVEEGTTYAKMLSKEDGRIDWTQTAIEIERQLRALNPWPGVWCMRNGKRLKVLEAEIADGSGKPGAILHRDLIVACGEGALKLTRVQPQDKKPMDGLSYVNGLHLNVGDVLA
ncbi:MAG: methionyl-tRNA formyltransferase [Alphaproteobacteria bacterium]|nr:methionyl-tRNA formyltransferase [Alphaproteobacteria bacterium]